jgi:hypothetical protein
VSGRPRVLGAIERTVRVSSDLIDRQTVGPGPQCSIQEFPFHRFTAAFNFRFALTM